MEQEQYKDLISEDWKWSIFHEKLKREFRMVTALSGTALVIIFLVLGARSVTTVDFAREQAAQPESMVNYSQEVSKFFDVRVSPVSLTAEDFAAKYYSEDDLQKLEDTIVTDLNSTGKISVEHIDIQPNDYAAKAQDPDFMQIRISDDIVVFTAITFSSQFHRMGRFIAIARKLDKWRLATIKTPASSNNLTSIFSLNDTAEKIYNVLNKEHNQ
jgi:hypothetical protein